MCNTAIFHMMIDMIPVFHSIFLPGKPLLYGVALSTLLSDLRKRHFFTSAIFLFTKINLYILKDHKSAFVSNFLVPNGHLIKYINTS